MLKFIMFKRNIMLNIENSILIVGLGNVGKEYEHTRHNVGFDVVDDFAYLLTNKNPEYKKGFDGEYMQIKFNNNNIYFLKPSTFMNNSGISVKKLSDYYKIQKENIIVVQDDMDLDIGVVKAKYSQGDGGHKGIRSINSCLNFSNYLRIKVGIGKPKRKNEVVDFVLSKFSLDEQDSFNNSLAEASKLLVYIVSLGYDKGLNKYYSQIDKQNKEDKSEK